MKTPLKILVLITVTANSFLAQAQSFNFHFDHFAIVVEDVDKSAEFYANALNLEETPHPDRTPGFRWFIINGNSQLHLIQKEFAPFEKNKSMHLCLATQNLDALIDHLKKMDIPYWDWPGKKNAVTERSDGVRQIYIKDPDGYWIEINTAEH